LNFPLASQVKAAAPEFYDHLPYHTSWSKVYLDYIFRTDVNPFNRVKREPAGSKKAN
jgi:sphingolipid delta-4 desaturase